MITEFRNSSPSASRVEGARCRDAVHLDAIKIDDLKAYSGIITTCAGLKALEPISVPEGVQAG